MEKLHYNINFTSIKTLRKFAKEYSKHDILFKDKTSVDSVAREKALLRLGRALKLKADAAEMEQVCDTFCKQFAITLNRVCQRDRVAGGRYRLPDWMSTLRRQLAHRISSDEDAGAPAGGASSIWVCRWHGGLRAQRLAEALAARARLARDLHAPSLFEPLPDYALSATQLRELWHSLCKLCVGKLRLLVSAGDNPASLNAGPALSDVEWRIADLVLLYGGRRREGREGREGRPHRSHKDISLVTEDSVELYEQLQPLVRLASLVQAHRLEEPAPQPERARRWLAAHRDYNVRGVVTSLVALQRRWHDTCRVARAVLARYWRALRGGASLAPYAPSAPPAPLAPSAPPAPFYVTLAKRFPHVMVEPLPPWRELVDQGYIIVDELTECRGPGECGSAGGAATDTGTDAGLVPEGSTDDIILVEQAVETIDVESAGDSDTNSDLEMVIDTRDTREYQLDQTSEQLTNEVESSIDLLDIDPTRAQATLVFYSDDDDDGTDDQLPPYAAENIPSNEDSKIDIVVNEIESYKTTDDIKNEANETPSDADNEIGTLVNSKLKQALAATMEQGRADVKLEECVIETGEIIDRVIEMELKKEETMTSRARLIFEEDSDGEGDSDRRSDGGEIDEKLLMDVQIIVKKLDEAPSWKKHRRRSTINVRRLRLAELDIPLARLPTQPLPTKHKMEESDEDSVPLKLLKKCTVPEVVTDDTGPEPRPARSTSKRFLLDKVRGKDTISISFEDVCDDFSNGEDELARKANKRPGRSQASNAMTLEGSSDDYFVWCVLSGATRGAGGAARGRGGAARGRGGGARGAAGRGGGAGGAAAREESVSAWGRVAKRVELPSREDIRKMNSSLLTAQVAPIATMSANTSTSTSASTSAVMPTLKETVTATVSSSPQQLQHEGAEGRSTGKEDRDPSVVADLDADPDLDADANLIIDENPDVRVNSEVSVNPDGGAGAQPKRDADSNADPSGAVGSDVSAVPGMVVDTNGGLVHGAGADRDGGADADAATGGALTAAELKEMLDELARLTRYPLPTAGRTYCCTARRHRAVNDARRRIADKAGRLVTDLNIHDAKHMSSCSCCCVHLVRDERRRDAVLDHQRRLKSRLRALLDVNPRQGENGSDPDYQPGANKRQKRSKAKKPEQPKPTTFADDYQEWIRQKNLNLRFFDLRPKKPPEIVQSPDNKKTKKSKRQSNKVLGKKKTNKKNPEVVTSVGETHPVPPPNVAGDVVEIIRSPPAPENVEVAEPGVTPTCHLPAVVVPSAPAHMSTGPTSELLTWVEPIENAPPTVTPLTTPTPAQTPSSDPDKSSTKIKPIVVVKVEPALALSARVGRGTTDVVSPTPSPSVIKSTVSQMIISHDPLNESSSDVPQEVETKAEVLPLTEQNVKQHDSNSSREVVTSPLPTITSSYSLVGDKMPAGATKATKSTGGNTKEAVKAVKAGRSQLKPIVVRLGANIGAAAGAAAGAGAETRTGTVVVAGTGTGAGAGLGIAPRPPLSMGPVTRTIDGRMQMVLVPMSSSSNTNRSILYAYPSRLGPSGPKSPTSPTDSTASNSAGPSATTLATPSAAGSAAPTITVAQFLQGKDPTALQILCLDEAKPLWEVAPDYLLVTDVPVPCMSPAYWTIAPADATCKLLLDPDSDSNPSPVSTQTPTSTPTPTPTSTPDPAPGLDSAGDSQVGKLRVKSFAKMPELCLDQGRVLAAPCNMMSDDKYYRKLQDSPLVYAQVVTVVSDSEQCRALLMSKRSVLTYSRRSALLAPLLDRDSPALQEVIRSIDKLDAQAARSLVQLCRPLDRLVRLVRPSGSGSGSGPSGSASGSGPSGSGSGPARSPGQLVVIMNNMMDTKTNSPTDLTTLQSSDEEQ